MMKLPVVFLFLIALPGSAQSQTSPSHNSQPELQVIRFSWSKYQQGISDLGTSGAGDRKSQGNDRLDRQIETRRQKAPEYKQAIEDLEEMKRQGQRAPAPRSNRPAEKASYKYTLEVKNTSAKQIARVAWDYVFTDPRTHREALRHSFESKVKIKPGGSAKVTAYKNEGPYQVVGVSGLSDKSSERIVIKRIVYSDGSVWED